MFRNASLLIGCNLGMRNGTKPDAGVDFGQPNDSHRQGSQSASAICCHGNFQRAANHCDSIAGPVEGKLDGIANLLRWACLRGNQSHHRARALRRCSSCGYDHRQRSQRSDSSAWDPERTYGVWNRDPELPVSQIDNFIGSSLFRRPIVSAFQDYWTD